MHFLNIIKQGLKDKGLSKRTDLKEMQSEDQELENSLTFFNRITQHVKAMNMHVYPDVQSQYLLAGDASEQLPMQPYIVPDQSPLQFIDPVYLIEGFQDKVFRYQVQISDNFPQRLGFLEESQQLVRGGIDFGLYYNHGLIYSSFLKVHQDYNHLAMVSRKLKEHRNQIKKELVSVLHKYCSLKQKVMDLKRSRAAFAFMQHFNRTVGVIYTNSDRYSLYQKLLAVRNNLIKFKDGLPIPLTKVKCLQNLQIRCQNFVVSSPRMLSQLVKMNMFEKVSQSVVVDIILSDFILWKSTIPNIFKENFDSHLQVIVEFTSKAQSVDSIKDYLQILIKYIRNLDKFHQEIKGIKSSALEELLPNESGVTVHLRVLKKQVGTRFLEFYSQVFTLLGEVCTRLLGQQHSAQQRRTIKKFIQLMEQGHHSEGFQDFRKKVKPLLKH